ncbi:uncharacterized protein LOC135464909 [Liolophura sinensis]|uniref:uncharacterized protein LOC135464909 n=1 Tax=Liolophura sinensis TaxID=3198878 RepID=UPI0031589091
MQSSDMLSTVAYRLPGTIFLCYFVTQTLTQQLAESEVEDITTTQMTTLGIVTDITPDLCASSCLSDDLSIVVGVVPVLCIIFLLVVVGVGWYMTSYKKALNDWAKQGRDGDRATDSFSGIGPDGRAVWEGLYGSYEAQEAMDMINIFMLAHHRLGERKLPIYAIRGQELPSIEHAFIHLPADKRPLFTSEKIMAGDNDRDDHGHKDDSVMPVSSSSSIVPLHRVEGSTCITDIDPKFNDEEPSGSEVPVSPNSHGDQVGGMKPPHLTPSVSGELSSLGDFPCLGKVPRPVQAAILPVCNKEQEFFITDI